MEFSANAFDRLVLAPSKKDLILAIVEQEGNLDEFDDIVKGKGKGLIFLLHGPPGVGKTLTAGEKPQ